MAGFWRRRSSSSSGSPKTNKEQSQQQQQQQQSNQIQDSKNHVFQVSFTNKKSSSPKDKQQQQQQQTLEIRNSPFLSKDHTSSSSGFSGFDSDSGEKKMQLPLPTPSGTDQGVFGGVATPHSSVSSSGSSAAEDHGFVIGGNNDICLATTLSGGYRLPNDIRGNGDAKYYTRSRSPVPGSRSPVPGSSSPRPGSRSPGPRSRVASRPQSPLHPNVGGTNMDSPTGRSEEGKNQAHPLPLPPGSPSPSSPSSLQSTRSAGVNETVALSKWKKGKLLGRGTFGHVYLGFNSESGQMCAIKEVKVVTDDQSSKECLKQLNQEINLLSQLSHPNIVRYHGSELSEDRLSVYLEYVSGGSIHKLLQEYGAFREPVIQNYTRQILSGLAYLHGLKTVHRDIKGANILVDPNGEIKLADFGMAKHITGCSSMLSFKGSPYWMAPEVVMNTNGYSLAVDIWSLGCTIIEMATSKPPWNQYEGVAAIFKIGNSRDMPDIPDHLSNDAKCFIKLCLQRDPSARPTAAKLLDHPFIRDQATSRVANINITRDAFPHTFDGSRTPPVLELHSNRTSIPSCDGDFAMKPGFVNSRVTRNARDNARMITSLPGSPCSSPLRQLGPAYQSCYVSPPHQAYALVGNGYNGSDHQSLHPIRRNTAYTLDPLFESSLFRSQTPGTSPSSRFI